MIGGLSRNTGLARFYGFNSAGIQFDARKFHWLGLPQQEAGLFLLSAKSGLHTIDDLRTRRVTVSSTADNSPTVYARLLNDTLGTKQKPITGDAGSQACLLALERDEVDAHISGGSSAPFRARILPWRAKGEVKVIMLMGMKRDPVLPGVPTAIEVEPTAAGKQLFEIAFAEQVMGRPFVLPPKMPADRVAGLRAAFDATMRDPGISRRCQGAESRHRCHRRRCHQRAARAHLCAAAGRGRAPSRHRQIGGGCATVPGGRHDRARTRAARRLRHRRHRQQPVGPRPRRLKPRPSDRGHAQRPCRRRPEGRRNRWPRLPRPGRQLHPSPTGPRPARHQRTLFHHSR